MLQISKQILTIGGAMRILFAFVMVFALMGPVGAINSRLSQSVVIDPLSGAAMNGFDPVSYFTESEPLRGRADFEVIWNGVPWFFSTEGNMQIFINAPEVYAPQFGGHGVMSLSRGFLSDGNPMIYSVLDNRLYLFYSFPNREAFALADKIARVDASMNWKNFGFGT